MKLKWPPFLQTPLKLLASLWILYHLLGIAIMPSVQSIIVKERGWIWRSYLNQLGLNTTWNLFSPDPATAMFMRVKLVQSDPEKNEIDLTIPDFADAINWNPIKRRALYLMRFTMMDPDKVYRFLIPWYCQHYPGTREIYIEGVGTRIPGIAQVQAENLNSASSLRERQTVKEYHGDCP
jgi:hypothetical protein